MSFFKKMQQELERIAGTHKVPVEINLDDSDYLDRVCPHEPCARGFKVKYDDVAKFGDDGWCVYCGHKDRDIEFATAAQAQHAEAVAFDHATQMFDSAMRRAAKATPRTTKTYGGKYASVTITETVTFSEEKEDMPRREPPEAWAVMRVEATCAS